MAVCLNAKVSADRLWVQKTTVKFFESAHAYMPIDYRFCNNINPRKMWGSTNFGWNFLENWTIVTKWWASWSSAMRRCTICRNESIDAIYESGGSEESSEKERDSQNIKVLASISREGLYGPFFSSLNPQWQEYSILWNNQQMQLYAVNFIPFLGSLYMFRVLYTPIIRSTIFNCSYSHWYKP